MSVALIAAAMRFCCILIHANATTAGFVFLGDVLVFAATWGVIEVLVASGAARTGKCIRSTIK